MQCSGGPKEMDIVDYFLRLTDGSSQRSSHSSSHPGRKHSPTTGTKVWLLHSCALQPAIPYGASSLQRFLHGGEVPALPMRIKGFNLVKRKQCFLCSQGGLASYREGTKNNIIPETWPVCANSSSGCCSWFPGV